jgi:hypothetical protein
MVDDESCGCGRGDLEPAFWQAEMPCASEIRLLYHYYSPSWFVWGSDWDLRINWREHHSYQIMQPWRKVGARSSSG